MFNSTWLKPSCYSLRHQEMLTLITLHLQLSKLFFALDRINKRLWPRYIADMHELKTKHPATWRELDNGNISITQSEIPFVSVSADHACEHLNRMMKVHSGLVGISNYANARQRFFLASPEISRLSAEFKGKFGEQARRAPWYTHGCRKMVATGGGGGGGGSNPFILLLI